MLAFEFDYSLKVEGLENAAGRYGRIFEKNAAEEAAIIMRGSIKIVPLSSPPSPPGGFPFSRTGELPKSIGVSESDEGYLVGPAFRRPESNLTLRGADTIAEILNTGGVVLVRRKYKSRRGRVTKTVTLRQNFLPRPYLELTLDIVARKTPEIARINQLN